MDSRELGILSELASVSLSLSLSLWLSVLFPPRVPNMLVSSTAHPAHTGWWWHTLALQHFGITRSKASIYLNLQFGGGGGRVLHCQKSFWTLSLAVFYCFNCSVWKQKKMSIRKSRRWAIYPIMLFYIIIVNYAKRLLSLSSSSTVSQWAP